MSIVPGRDIPEAPEAWIDAINERINDENHLDLCGCNHWPAACRYYKAGQWDEGNLLHIAAAVLEPLIRAKVLAELGLSSAWAVWSDDGRLLDVTTYDSGPVPESRVRADLAQAVVPITGRFEPVSLEQAEELRAQAAKEQQR